MSITGAEQLDAVAAAMAAASSDIRRETQAALVASKPALTAAARASALAHLPKGGGLNRRVASDPFALEQRGSILQAGIRFGTSSTDARSTNRGRIRHPVFGHRDRFVEQLFPPAAGWFDKAMKAAEPEVLRLVEAALESLARKVSI